MFRILLLSCLVVCAVGRTSIILRPRISGKIVGGEPAKIEDYPYQLYLRRVAFFSCSASIVSETLAITSAACTDGASYTDLSVRAGSSVENSGGSIHYVTKIHQNPGFDPHSMDGDISILEVYPPFQFGSAVQPIALPDSNMNVTVGSNADVSGWGVTSEGGTAPGYLKHVVVPVVDQDECNKAYETITDNMICAGAQGKDFCTGDLGAPLVEGGKLIGIASFYYGCARLDYPGVYTRVTALRDWIKKEVGL